MNKHAWVMSLGTVMLGLAAMGGLAWGAAVRPPVMQSEYSAPALFDLGNLYARAGRPAMAVLSYERARVLAPADPNIQMNLRHVRESAGLTAPQGDWLSQHERWADPNILYWIGVLGLTMTGLTLLLRRAGSRHRRLLNVGAIVGSLMMAMSLCDAIATASTLNEYVVMAATPARASPAPAAEPLFTVSLADVVQVRDEHQGFALIRDTQGREAWVSRKDLAPVIPRPQSPTSESTSSEATR